MHQMISSYIAFIVLLGFKKEMKRYSWRDIHYNNELLLGMHDKLSADTDIADNLLSIPIKIVTF